MPSHSARPEIGMENQVACGSQTVHMSSPAHSAGIWVPSAALHPEKELNSLSKPNRLLCSTSQGFLVQQPCPHMSPLHFSPQIQTCPPKAPGSLGVALRWAPVLASLTSPWPTLPLQFESSVIRKEHLLEACGASGRWWDL